LVGRDAGIFQGFPGDLEQQSLLRFHPGRFPRRDAEEPSVETGDITQERTASRVDGAWLVGIVRNRQHRIPPVFG
jgi:hypothetical protein